MTPDQVLEDVRKGFGEYLEMLPIINENDALIQILAYRVSEQMKQNEQLKKEIDYVSRKLASAYAGVN